MFIETSFKWKGKIIIILKSLVLERSWVHLTQL